MTPEIRLRALDFELVRDNFEDRWNRGDPQEARVVEQAPGHFQVALEDGDATHQCILAQRDDVPEDVPQYEGWCDCDGYTFHTKTGDGPCSHLCALGKLTVFHEIDVPPSGELDLAIGLVDRPDRGKLASRSEVRSDGGRQPFEAIQEHRKILRDINQMQDNLDELADAVREAEWIELGGKGFVNPSRIDTLYEGVEGAMPYIRESIHEVLDESELQEPKNDLGYRFAV